MRKLLVEKQVNLKNQKVNYDKPIKNSGTDLLIPQKGKLNVWLLVGVNGVGKTHIRKISLFVIKE